MTSNDRFGLPNHVIKKIQDVFLQHQDIKKVILYGSRATGKYKQGSDIDLCIEGENLNLTKLMQIETQLDDLLLPWKIDLSLKQHIDNQGLLQKINKNGLIFYTW